MTLTERKSEFALAGLVRRFRAANVYRQMNRLLVPLPKTLKQTLTLDNSKEFPLHEHLSKNANIDVYFVRPYHPWERGSYDMPPS